jgi:hypothetical protein
LTRGASMPLALTGSLKAVQFCCPAELPLTLDKIEHFETGLYRHYLTLLVIFNLSVV